MKINIFGSTGIIGSKTLDILKNNFPQIKINLLCANRNVKKLIQQVNIFKPKYVFLNDINKINILKKNINHKITILNFKELISYLFTSKSDLSLLAISGYKSLNYLEPILKNTSSLGLVSKEAIVSSGHLFKKFNKQIRNKIYPLDSEHFSIFQYIKKNNIELKQIKLTASGGPFLGKNYKSLEDISFSEASNHPKWKMGYKNSIDSATLVNKCLELIEAHYLFDVPFTKLDILIHPESLVHSIIEDYHYVSKLIYFYNDMKIPIINFLNNDDCKYLPINNKFNFINELTLNFTKVDFEIYPIYNYFKSIDKSNPRNLIKFNLGNEYAVDLFKQKKIKYIEILQLIKEITSLNIDSDVNNIHNIIQYHENLKLYIKSNFV